MITRKEIFEFIREDLYNMENRRLTPFNVDLNTIKESTEFYEIGMDSLDIIDLIFSLENEYNLNIDETKVHNIKDIIDIVDENEKINYICTK